VSILGTLASATHLSPFLFRPIRRAAGPLHRRRRSLESNPNEQYPPLPAPWTDERWFRDDFPPREHNSVELLHDGEAYLSNLYASLLTARNRVTIAGWCLTPLIPLLRDENVEDSILADVLNEVSKQAEVYVLLWSGSPALFAPTERETEEARKTLLQRAPRVHCELDHQAPFSHDHHQKAVTIDGLVAYVGGMDLTTYEGDRWDTTEAARRGGARRRAELLPALERGHRRPSGAD
jgi:phosphatidylserine/phosphatidylglycerophosphate/cardiolipin synthase-like enzyme